MIEFRENEFNDECSYIYKRPNYAEKTEKVLDILDGIPLIRILALISTVTLVVLSNAYQDGATKQKIKEMLDELHENTFKHLKGTIKKIDEENAED